MTDPNDPPNDYIMLMRAMYADARICFREMAEPLIDGPDTQEFVDSLALAIGEVSPDEAVEALRRWKVEKEPETP